MAVLKYTYSQKGGLRMKQFNTCNGAPVRNRDGASSKDFWKIYNMLPSNTYLDLSFIDSFSDSLLERIGFAKDGSADLEKSVSEYEESVKRAFRRLGYDGYRSLEMIWNKGFGNSVRINIYIDLERRQYHEKH